MFLNLCHPLPRAKRVRARLVLEALEGRTLLSAGLIDLNLAGTASGNNAALESRDAGQLGSGARQRQTPDGRFVVFESPSSDLVDPSIDVNGTHPDVFLRDRQAGTTQAVSLRDGVNVTGNDNSYSPVISPDGRYAVFESIATDLVPNEPAGANLFLRDLQAKRTFLLGPGAAGAEGGNDAAFSGNSQFVTYTSDRQVYVRNLSAGTTALVSVNKNGTGPGLGTSQEPTISADGRYVAFTSIAQDLVPNFVNAFSTDNLFLRDMQNGTTTVLTHDGDIGGNGDSINPHLSDNGRTLVFESTAYNLGLNDTNTNLNDILAYDLPSGSLSLVSANAGGTGSGDSSSFQPVVSADGRYVAFESLANDLTTNTGGNGTNKNVFVRDLQTGTTTLVSINSAHTGSGNNESGLPSISADGRMIAFESRSTDLVPDFVKQNGGIDFDIYLYDQQAGTVSLLSSDYRNPAGSGNGSSLYPVISADGRYVIFHSTASNLDPRDTGPETDVFVSPPTFSAGSGGPGGGVISGSVFRDFNTNGVQDPGEPGIAGQTVFIDVDGSGQLKAGDPTATTDANGNYQFAGLSTGTYTVRQVLLGGVLLSAPGNGSYQVSLTSGMGVTGQNFADVLTSIAVPLTLPPVTPFPAQGNANADYVEALYRAILDRNADAGGLANWTNLLNSGRLSRLQVVQGIRNSPEHFTQEVTDFYLTLLNRPPDLSGLQNWVQHLEAGMREEQMAFDFLDSPEYLSQGDKHFVDAMYLSLLGRPFDPAGEAHWLDQLGDDTNGNPTHPASMTHEQVITAFLYSTESLTRLTEGYYEVFLQRPADPGGLSSWVGQLQHGVPFLTIGQQFLASDEFYNGAARHG
jgi:Tol biopolymer transport system component